MGFDVLPTGIITGVVGSAYAAPAVVTLNHGETSVIAAGAYWLYGRSADMDLELQTAAGVWTKMADGDDAPDGFIIHSDGINVRLHNSHVATDNETASLVKIG